VFNQPLIVMNRFNALAPQAHWLLRIGLSSVFLYHGLTKFPVLSGMAEMMGMPVVMVALIAILETAGGVLVLVGGFGPDWATRLGGLFIAPIMLGAIFMVHLQHGWNSINMGTGNMGRGMEFQFVLLVTALYFLLAGNAHSGTAEAAPEVATQAAGR
jgi:putative oxidoreductase